MGAYLPVFDWGRCFPPSPLTTLDPIQRKNQQEGLGGNHSAAHDSPGIHLRSLQPCTVSWHVSPFMLITDSRPLDLISMHPTGWSSQPYGSFASQPFQPSPQPHGDFHAPPHQWGYPHPSPPHYPPQEVRAVPPGGNWEREVQIQGSNGTTPLRTVHSHPINLMDADDLDNSPPGHSPLTHATH